MVLEHAPVTGLTLLFSSIMTAVVPDRYANRAEALRRGWRPNASASARVTAATITGSHHGGGTSERLATSNGGGLLSWRRSLGQWLWEAPPLGPLGGGHNLWDVVLASSIVHQARALERRWGSMSFLSFLLTSSSVGVALMHALVSDTTSSSHGGVLTIEGVYVLSAGASLVPLTALVTRYLYEVPALSRLRLPIPGTSITLTTDHVTLLGPLLKLVLVPATVLEHGTHRRPAVIVDIGLCTRLLLLLVGTLFGLLSARPSWLSWWLAFFGRRVCRPLLNLLQPVLSPVFGPTTCTVHVLRRHLQSGTSNHVDPGLYGAGVSTHRQQEGGRISVGSLTEDATPTEDWQRMRMRASAAPQRPGMGQSSGRGTHAREEMASTSVVSADALSRVLEMGLPVSREDIIEALQVTAGDVAGAVHLLLERF